jgi:hypothetical protein
MNYRLYKQSRRDKSAINFYGYSRNLSKKRVQTGRRYDENFDSLEFIIDTVKSELSSHFQRKNETVQSQLSLKRLQSSTQARKLTTLTVDLNANGESNVALVTSNLNEKYNKTHKTVKIENQIANYDAILKIIERLERKLGAETDEILCEDYSNRIKNLKGYIDLIKFCFKYLGKSGDDVHDVNSDFFQVCDEIN